MKFALCLSVIFLHVKTEDNCVNPHIKAMASFLFGHLCSQWKLFYTVAVPTGQGIHVPHTD